MSNKKLWGGRFSQPTEKAVERFTASVHFDNRLAKHDIIASIAHAKMLGKCSIITSQCAEQIIKGLDVIAKQIEQDQFVWDPQLEDVHMNIEACLTSNIGESGKMLHTARSRNDQVATDMRLYARDFVDDIIDSLRKLQTVLIDLAQKHSDTIMPGLTHLQSAQPIVLGHHVLAWFEMLDRDVSRFTDSRVRINVSPLGSAALAGTTFPIDRNLTASLLGFEQVSENSLDGVSDRDFILELCANIAILGMHFSRIAEELVFWSSDRFAYLDLGDAFCTGSSIMPQKKNPDIAELLRGKSGRVIGNLNSLLVIMKGQALAYNRDNQEDKEPFFDSVDTALACSEILRLMLSQVKVNKNNMREAAGEGFSTATDLADYLVTKHIPFRSAHEIVGKIVNYCIENSERLENLSLQVLKNFEPKIEMDVFDVLSLEGSVNNRNHLGATSPVQVKSAIKRARLRVKDC